MGSLGPFRRLLLGVSADNSLEGMLLSEIRAGRWMWGATLEDSSRALSYSDTDGKSEVAEALQ